MKAGGGPSPGPPEEGLSLRLVLDLLPELRLLMPLREEMLTASHADAASTWHRDRRYATLERRVLDGERIEGIVRSVARRESENLANLMRGVGEALRARAEGRRRDAVQSLRELAAALAESERHYEAAAVLEVALREAAFVDDRTLEADVVRWLAKASWRVGRLERSTELYQRAAEMFARLGDTKSRATARQGLGNVLAAQGRWRDAEEQQREALSLCGEADDVLRGQIFNNLSQVSRRQGRIADARAWQEGAEEVWAVVDAPADRVIALNNRALLHLVEDLPDDARDCLVEGLTLAVGDLQRANLLVNLAQVELRAGAGERAERLAREAEEFAVVAGASDILVEAYTVLGMVFRERGEDHCVPFFEKALELASPEPFRLLRADAHHEYARYRRDVGDVEEARAHLERARDIYEALDAERDADEARRELAAMETDAAGAP